MGDLGLLLPIALALIAINGLHPTVLLAAVGLQYAVTGWYFRLPLPVQPMKALAMIAVARQVPPGVIAAAAVTLGGVLLLLAIGGLAGRLARLFPHAIVRGIQAAIGLLLLHQGVRFLFDLRLLNGAAVPAAPVVALIGAGLLLALRGGFVPLLLVPLGVVLGGWVTGGIEGFPAGPLPVTLRFPTGAEFGAALGLLVLPQIPLTVANSIIAPPQVARDYFGERAGRITERALACSLGIGNLIAGTLGGMPCCHGSGGLTAHVRSGARTGGATILLGGGLILLGLLAGPSVRSLIGLFPYPVLGLLLALAGAYHLGLLRDLRGRRGDFVVALAIGAAAWAASSLVIGIAVGYGLYGWIRLRVDRSAARTQSARGIP